MTICITGISESGIIFVSDSMISTEEFSGDRIAFKLVALHDDWKALYAGNDLARVTPMSRRICQYMEEAGKSEGPCSHVDIEEAIRRAWKEELRIRIEDRVLNRYLLTTRDFLQHGETYFGSQYQSMKYQIDEIRLGFELLVAGYDSYERPNILSIADPGGIVHHTPYRFWAIGSGANSAISHFFSYKGDFFPEEHNSVVYKCVAAKFAAESSPGVGKNTTVVILNNDGTLCTWAGTDKIRHVWEKYGKPKMTPECIEEVKSSLLTATVGPRRDPPMPSTSDKSNGQQ
jgi:hypothetical protein